MCDWLAGDVLLFDADANREVVVRVEGMPFSIDWLPDGRLVMTTPGGVVVGPDLHPDGATWPALQRDRCRSRWPNMGGYARLDAVGGTEVGERFRRVAR